MIEFIDNVIDENIFIHLGKNNIKKFQLLLAMIQKLSVQRGLSNEDNPDSFDSQNYCSRVIFNNISKREMKIH